MDIFFLLLPIFEEHPKPTVSEGEDEEEAGWSHLVCGAGGMDVFKNSGLFQQGRLPPARVSVGEVSQHPRLPPLSSGLVGGQSGEIRG